MPTKSSIPSTFLGVESGNYYLRETKQASAPLRNYYSISSTILKVQPCRYDPASNWWGDSDASARPDGRAYIGGWLADKENFQKRTLGGFTIRFRWRTTLGHTKRATRRISALELFGTLILTHFLLIKAGKALLRTRPSLISDNQGNIFALLNQRTKQMPTCSVRQGYNWLLHT